MNKIVHISHLAVLVVLLGAGVFTLMQLQGNIFAQTVVGIATSVAYVCWGIIHHWVKKDLYKKVVIEYILIGIVAIFVLLIILHE